MSITTVLSDLMSFAAARTLFYSSESNALLCNSCGIVRKLSTMSICAWDSWQYHPWRGELNILRHCVLHVRLKYANVINWSKLVCMECSIMACNKLLYKPLSKVNGKMAPVKFLFPCLLWFLHLVPRVMTNQQCCCHQKLNWVATLSHNSKRAT